MKTINFEDLAESGNPTPTDGTIILGMPNEVYHKAPGISHSGLTLVARSPAHFKFQPPREATRQQAIGSAIHTALLEPETFDNEYYCLNDVKDRRASAYKEAAKTHDPDKLLTGPEGDNVKGMQEAVWSQPAAKRLLEAEGYRECVVFARDPVTGLLTKCKFDILTTAGRAVDLKKTQDARPDAFGRAVFNYRYHCQVAFYSDVYKWATGEELKAFAILAVEEKLPHAAMVYVLDDKSIELGQTLYRKALNRFADCVEANEWPAYSEEPELLSMPVWAERKDEDEATTE